MSNKYVMFGVIISCILLSFSIFANMTEAVKSSTYYDSISDTSADWTVMYYVCGDLKWFGKDPEKIIENLTKIGSTNKLNIVVMSDGTKIGDTKLYYINTTGKKEVLNEKYGWPDEVNTGNPNTLRLFCKQMMDAYPAKYYGLVIVAPGGTGWQVRPLTDTHPREHGPSMPVFGETLREITDDGTRKIDVINMNSCVLGMLENAYEIAPYVNYMTASEDHVPDGTHCVQRFYKATWDLRNNTKLTPKEYANRTPIRHNPMANFSLDVFITFAGRESPLTKLLNKLLFPELHTISMHSTSSAVNLSKIHNLTQAVDDLSSILILNLHDKGIKEAIKTARQNVREYGKATPKFLVFLRRYFYKKLPLEIFAYDCFIDLYNFAELLSEHVDNTEIKNTCYSVMEKLEDAITANTIVPGDDSHGLSIYFPSHKILYNRYVGRGKNPPSPYEELQFSKDTNWDEFLREYLNI